MPYSGNRHQLASAHYSNYWKWFSLIFSFNSFAFATCSILEAGKPNILIIIADDLGFNDVSFHGSRQIPTPNIDALAYSGVILNSYYVSPICTPSRSSFFTGKHPIHTGMQHGVIYGASPYGLSLDEKLLPEYLKDYGYATHLVGKWHLGHFRRTYTPTCRGFDSHYGSWTGHKDYYDNTAQENGPQAWGYDMRRNLDVTYENIGNYTTDLYTAEAVKIIAQHNISVPLFLTISHTAVHSANPYSYLQAPQDVIDRFSYIENIARRKFAAMVSKLDDSVGAVIAALEDAQLLYNSIVIFTTDNGGPAAGFNDNAASNWPLRGVKNTLFEGGVRGAAFLWSPLIQNPSRVSWQLMHIQDWLPTLISAIGEGQTNLGHIDGIDLWNALSTGAPSSREELLHNIDESYGNEAIRVGDWKLMHGTTYNGKWDGWFGPSGLQSESEIQAKSKTFETSNQLIKEMLQSDAGKALQREFKNLVFRNKTKIQELQVMSRIQCGNFSRPTPCNLTSGEYCLFNIKTDPCEQNNVAMERPEIVIALQAKLEDYRMGSVPPRNRPKDPRGQPKFWNYTWTNWMDYTDPEPESDTKTLNHCLVKTRRGLYSV